MKGISPSWAKPAAAQAMLASAMPKSKKRSGYTAEKRLVMVALERSASSTTILSFSAPSSASASP